MTDTSPKETEPDWGDDEDQHSDDMTDTDANQTEDVSDGESSEIVRAAWDSLGFPSTAVIEAVASAKGKDPMEMPCLYDFLDVDALDSLLTSDRTEAQRNVAVSFTYDGTFVWVDSGGGIEIDPDPVN